MAVGIADVINALKRCVDPELGMSIVDLGLIYGIDIHDKDVKLVITMTSPMCPVTSIILADAELRIKAIEGIGNVDVELVWDPAWTPEMIDEEARAQLNA